MSNAVYQLYKNAGLCPICGKLVEKGHTYCPYHTQKRREAVKRYYRRNKEREKTDPVFREREKRKRAQNRIRYRAKCRAEGRCYACGKPATHGVYCTKHWMENIEKYSTNPYGRLTARQKKLTVPPISDKVRVDVGKIIALYNAGWTYKYIALDMKISKSTVGYYVKMARTAEKGEKG